MTRTPAKRLLIRADASAEIGLGHLMRCLTLATALRQKGIECFFAFRQLPEGLQQQVTAAGSQLCPLPESAEQSDAQLTLALAKRLDAAALLVDHYGYDFAALQQLTTGGLPLIVMDDLNDRGPLPAALVINSLPHADRLGYAQTAPAAQLLLGLSYVLLRAEFCHLPELLPASKRPRLLVNFGGSDILGLSLPVTRGLLEKDPQLPLTLITGGGFRAPEQAQQLAEEFPQVEHLHNCQTMAEQLCRAGLALAAPGATVYELAACGVPAVFLLCADNQALSAAAHEQHGWCRVFDARQQNGLASALELGLQLWQNPTQRDRLQQHTTGLVSGGAKRIAEKIEQLMGQP